MSCPLFAVWGYALLSVTIVSLVGLVAVAIIPVMQKMLFNYLIQFLVALAIGSLTGDALLHLIPHVGILNVRIDQQHQPNCIMNNPFHAPYSPYCILTLNKSFPPPNRRPYTEENC